MHPNYQLEFIVAQSDAAIAQRYLLRSPCLSAHLYPLHIHEHVSSAADAFNPHSMNPLCRDSKTWWVWVHQDVYLPSGWDLQFLDALAFAETQWPNLGIIGLYGIQNAGGIATRVGSVLDRGVPLHETEPLPARVDSLDELLIATRADLQLGFDPKLGFDFYGTDLVLEAQKRGITAVVVHAPCEHWSSSPKAPPFPAHLIDRVQRSANYFEQKWQNQLPIFTPCFEIYAPGDTYRFITQQP